MSTQEVFSGGNLTADDELCTESRQEERERIIFGLALALATEPSKLAQLRQMLVQLQEEKAISEDFCTWAHGQLDEQVRTMALEYAYDAETLVQILSFKGGTFAGLLQEIEDLYQHEQITQRVYVTAKLLLRTDAQRESE
jgi:hypothetical protein